MYLIKFLAEEYLKSAIEKGAIRIGTINYYRQIEDETRKDANEGLGEIIWKGQKLSAKDHNRIFTFTENVEMINNGTIENKGVPLVGSYPNFNVYTFCLSQTDSLDEKELERISGGKSPHFYFIADYPQFVRILTSKIKESALMFIRENKTDITPELIDKVEVIDCTYGINYSDASKARIVTEDNLETFNPTQIHTQDFFQKQTSFSNEQEVRIIWLFVLQDGKQVKPLSFPLPDIEFLDLSTGELPISNTAIENRYPIKVSPLKSII